MKECDVDDECFDDYTCYNTIGYYQCNCNNGFIFDDMDECHDPVVGKIRNVRTLQDRLNVHVKKHRTTEHNYDVDNNYDEISKCVNLDGTFLCICRI